MFETAMLFDLMEKLQKKAHQNSKTKGFWEGPENTSVPVKLCLMHSEISEWLEAYRKGGDKPCDKKFLCPVRKVEKTIGIIDGSAPEGHRTITNMEEEAADVMIRLLDLCEYLNIDLMRVTLAKMEYNETRPMKHGGKKI